MNSFVWQYWRLAYSAAVNCPDEITYYGVGNTGFSWKHIGCGFYVRFSVDRRPVRI